MPPATRKPPSGRQPAPAPRQDGVRIGVDRVLCTGHGICAQVLPQEFQLDEWGYPIVLHDVVDPKDAVTAVKLCPAAALYER